MTPERAKKIGDLAENYFAELCIGAGLNKSRPGRDETGWDFFVELPQNRIPAVFLDSQSPPIKFLCQVKATDNLSDNPIRMKISNFEHLARTPLPTFVFIVDFQGNDRPQDVYFCHFNQQRVASTLSKIRELDAAGESDLHKHSMTLSIAPSELIRPSDLADFSKCVTIHSGHDLSKYMTAKAQWLSTLGYEEGRYRLTFTTSMSISALVDASLGLSPLHFESGSMADIRFGVDLKKELVSGVLSLEPMPAGGCRIVASSRKANKRVEVDAKVFLPFMSGVPIENLKCRIIAMSFETIIAPPKCNLSFRLDSVVPYEFYDLIKNIAFMDTCTNNDVKIEFWRGSLRFASVSPDFMLDLDKAFKIFLSRLRIAEAFFSRIGYRNSILARPKDFFGQRENFQWANLVARGRKQEVSTEIETTQTLALRNSKGLFASPVLLECNDRNVAAFCYWKASYRIESNTIKIMLRDCTVWSTMSFATTDTEEFFAQYNEFRSFCLEKSGQNALMMRSFNTGGGADAEERNLIV